MKEDRAKNKNVLSFIYDKLEKTVNFTCKDFAKKATTATSIILLNNHRLKKMLEKTINQQSKKNKSTKIDKKIISMKIDNKISMSLNKKLSKKNSSIHSKKLNKRFNYKMSNK